MRPMLPVLAFVVLSFSVACSAGAADGASASSSPIVGGDEEATAKDKGLSEAELADVASAWREAHGGFGPSSASTSDLEALGKSELKQGQLLANLYELLGKNSSFPRSAFVWSVNGRKLHVLVYKTPSDKSSIVATVALYDEDESTYLGWCRSKRIFDEDEKVTEYGIAYGGSDTLLPM